MSTDYPCPACGFLVFDEASGCFEICPVCDWQDDSVQLKFPLSKVGANQRSLYEEQLSILDRIPQHVQEFDGYVRAGNWRPLRQNELEKPKPPQTGKEWFDKIPYDVETYYWDVTCNYLVWPLESMQRLYNPFLLIV